MLIILQNMRIYAEPRKSAAEGQEQNDTQEEGEKY